MNGIVELPGDKSISHRAAMLGAIANGTTRISRFSAGDDCAATLRCLAALGAQIKRDRDDVTIAGSGKYGLAEPHFDLDCGNSGTTMRLLAGVLAGQDFSSRIVGDASLENRPMKRIIDPLTAMGAEIRSNDDRPPLTVNGRKPLHAIEYNLPLASAQLKSCVLLAGLFADGTTSVIEPTSTRDHTERMLTEFGVAVRLEDSKDGRKIAVTGDAELVAGEISVPGDISAAAFVMAAASCLEGSDITMRNVGVNPTRRAFLDVLLKLGADVELSDEREVSNEPTASIRVRGAIKQTGETLVCSGAQIGNLIDEIPVLAVLGTQLDGGIEVRDARELRVKESDRIAATCDDLRRMNAKVDEYDDGFRVYRSELHGAIVDSFGDHRIAMAFAVAALLATGETQITRSECVAVSFPQFFESLNSVVTY